MARSRPRSPARVSKPAQPVTNRGARKRPPAPAPWPPEGVRDLRRVPPAPHPTPENPSPDPEYVQFEEDRRRAMQSWPVVDRKCGECGQPMGEKTHGIRCSWWDWWPDATPF
jgi:hypothetical protein